MSLVQIVPVPTGDVPEEIRRAFEIRNVVENAKVELRELRRLGIPLFRGALNTNRLHRFLSDFEGGSRDLSDALDCYLMLKPK